MHKTTFFTAPPVDLLKQYCRFFLVLVMLHLSSAVSGAAADNPPAEIPGEMIQRLIREFDSINPRQSASTVRRAYKESIRKGQDLLARHPEAGNRYQLLYVVMKWQRRLLARDRPDRTRQDLFATCKLLAAAPDDYAAQRFEAEMILSERDLAARDATFQERAAALRSLVDQYRNTPAELKSLMAGVVISEQRNEMDGKQYYFRLIQRRFAGDSQGIAFVRRHIGMQRMDVIFSGRFERNDGTVIHFPHDRLGHAAIAVFWSAEAEESIALLSQLKEQQDAEPDRFEIFSFNLDELEDSGASVLKTVGLDCSVMKLPGGKKSETFRTYANIAPQALLINEYGRAYLEPKQQDQELAGHKGGIKEKQSFVYPKRMPGHGRYQMLLQSLFNGDFFVQDGANHPPKAGSLPAEILDKMQSSIPAGPFRYRLSPEEAADRYAKLEQLSSSALAKHAESPESWRIHNYRIVAQMGLWSCTGEPEHMVKAVAQSRTLLAGKLPGSAVMVAQYCLARHALREKKASAKTVIETFVRRSGGPDASPMISAAASILALSANAADLHDHYRDLFLRSKGTSPYAVLSFLRNRRHRYYLFQADISYLPQDRHQKYRERRYAINNDVSVPDTPFPSTLFRKLDGSTKLFPAKDGGKVTVVVFVEPPADGSLDLSPGIFWLPPEPVPEPEPEPAIDEGKVKKGRKRKKKKKTPRPPRRTDLLYTLSQLAKTHVSKNLDVVLAFLGDDLDQLRALNEKYKFSCEVVSVPGGLNHPLVRSLDLSSADQTPNLFLVRPDGTIPWHAGGFRYRVEPGSLSWKTYLALRTHIFRSEMEAGYAALKRRDFEKARTIFTGPYLVETDLRKLENWRQDGGRSEFHRWTTTQHYGKALAHIGLEEWDQALISIEKAQVHYVVYFRHDPEKPSPTGIALNRTHAFILDKLGRASEARALRNKAAVKPTDYPGDPLAKHGCSRPYEVFHARMSQLGIAGRR